MRTIAGILCFFLFVYMLTFVHLTSDSRGVVLIAPGTASFNALNMYSVWWLILPVFFGFYFIITSELDYYNNKRRKLLDKK